MKHLGFFLMAASIVIFIGHFTIQPLPSEWLCIVVIGAFVGFLISLERKK